MKHPDNQDTEFCGVRREVGGNGEHGANGAGGGLAAQKIDQSIAYMLEHLNKPLQVAKLAALVNVSASHYFALFKRRTGCAPIDFFIRLRMRQACRLLCGTSLSVKEVAAALGYEDPFYFSRMFKSVVQVAPSEYRLLTQGREDVHTLRPAPVLARLPAGSRNRRSVFGPRKSEPAQDRIKSVGEAEMAQACATVGA